MALTAFLGIFGITRLRMADDSDSILYERNTKPLSEMVKLSTAFQRMRVNVREVLLTENHDAGLEFKKKVEDLSPREFQVLLLIGQGKTVGEIAEMVSLSVKTISTYRARLISKLKLKNNSDIIRFCLKNKMVK